MRRSERTSVIVLTGIAVLITAMALVMRYCVPKAAPIPETVTIYKTETVTDTVYRSHKKHKSRKGEKTKDKKQKKKSGRKSTKKKKTKDTPDAPRRDHLSEPI